MNEYRQDRLAQERRWRWIERGLLACVVVGALAVAAQPARSQNATLSIRSDGSVCHGEARWLSVCTVPCRDGSYATQGDVCPYWTNAPGHTYSVAEIALQASQKRDDEASWSADLAQARAFGATVSVTHIRGGGRTSGTRGFEFSDNARRDRWSREYDRVTRSSDARRHERNRANRAERAKR